MQWEQRLEYSLIPSPPHESGVGYSIPKTAEKVTFGLLITHAGKKRLSRPSYYPKTRQGDVEKSKSETNRNISPEITNCFLPSTLKFCLAQETSSQMSRQCNSFFQDRPKTPGIFQLPGQRVTMWSYAWVICIQCAWGKSRKSQKFWNTSRERSSSTDIWFGSISALQGFGPQEQLISSFKSALTLSYIFSCYFKINVPSNWL